MTKDKNKLSKCKHCGMELRHGGEIHIQDLIHYPGTQWKSVDSDHVYEVLDDEPSHVITRYKGRASLFHGRSRMGDIHEVVRVT